MVTGPSAIGEIVAVYKALLTGVKSLIVALPKTIFVNSKLAMSSLKVKVAVKLLDGRIYGIRSNVNRGSGYIVGNANGKVEVPCGCIHQIEIC